VLKVNLEKKQIILTSIQISGSVTFVQATWQFIMHTVWWHCVYFYLCFKPRLATRFQGPGSRFSKRIAFPTTAVVSILCFVLCVEQKAGIKIHARFSNQLPDAVNLSNPGQRFCISHHEIQYLIFTLRECFSHYSTRKLFFVKVDRIVTLNLRFSENHK